MKVMFVSTAKGEAGTILLDDVDLFDAKVVLPVIGSM